MKWSKRKVEPKDLDKLFIDYTKAVNKGDVSLDSFYCIFEYDDEESNITYMLTIFDFLDQYKSGLIYKNKISNFYTCQPYY